MSTSSDNRFLAPLPPPERPTLFRDAETDFALDVLGKTRLRNLLLVGPAGCGKTQLVREVAARSPGYEFREISLGALVAGCPRVGEFEGRVRSVFSESRALSRRLGKPVVLFADEAQSCFGAGSTHNDPNELDFANLSKPYLSDGLITLWLAVTDRDYAHGFASDPAYSRRFVALRLDPLTPTQTMEVLRGMGFGCGEDALEAAIRLSSGTLPDRAIDLLDLAASRSRRTGEAITPSLIEEVAGRLWR